MSLHSERTCAPFIGCALNLRWDFSENMVVRPPTLCSGENDALEARGTDSHTKAAGVFCESRWDVCRGAVGLLGGSFNPAHAGHVYISLTAIRALALDGVWWLVSPQNPLKTESGMAPLSWRVAQAHRVTANFRHISVLDLEAQLGTHHSVEMIFRLRRREPSRCFIWLMGADNLAQVSFWWRWPSLFHLVPVAVLARDPYSLRALASVAARRFARFRVTPDKAHVLARRKPPVWVFLPVPSHPDAATKIRAVSGTWWDKILDW